MLAEIVEATISVAGLGLIVYGPWQWACTDWARQRMFIARDRLHDLASSGQIDFDNPAYRSVRSEINNMIRFAHELTWTRLIFLAWALRQESLEKPPVYRALDGISSFGLKQQVRGLVADTEKAAVMMIFMKSPALLLVGIVTIIPFVVCVVAYVCAREFLAEVTNSMGSLIQREASIVGRA